MANSAELLPERITRNSTLLRLFSKATADSIRAISETIAVPGGREAVNMRLSQQMITKLGALSNGQKVVLPADLMRIDDVLKSIGLEGTTAVPIRPSSSSSSSQASSPSLSPAVPRQAEPVHVRPMAPSSPSMPAPPMMPLQPWPPAKPE